MSLGDNIKKAREKFGYTQAECAELVGVSQPTYSLYENSKRTPTIDKGVKIAKALGTTCEELVEEE